MKKYVTKPIPAAKPAVAFVQRPWSSFEQFANNRDCTLSLMTVLPGLRLSLQSHTGRAELWIVIDDGGGAGRRGGARLQSRRRDLDSGE